MRRFAILASVLFHLWLGSSSVAWADSKEDAATAYDRGAAAYDRGDFVTAANELARADELAQSPVTLELAISAAVRADEPELAMTLVERAEKRKGNKALDLAAANAKKKLGAKVGKLNVVCPSSASRCVVAVDGTHFEPGAPRWIAVGAHKVSVTRSSTTPEIFDVTIEAGKTVELVPSSSPPAGAVPSTPSTASQPTPPPPPPPVVEKPTKEAGPSPTWFWVSLGLTGIAGAATVISGLDTMSKRDAFLADRSNQAAADAGQAADTRTVILIAATGVLAAVTTIVGVFVVDWKGAPPGRATGNRTVLRLTSTGLVF